MTDPKRDADADDLDHEQHQADGPHEIEDAAAAELETPADESDEG